MEQTCQPLLLYILKFENWITERENRVSLSYSKEKERLVEMSAKKEKKDALIQNFAAAKHLCISNAKVNNKE